MPSSYGGAMRSKDVIATVFLIAAKSSFTATSLIGMSCCF